MSCSTLFLALLAAASTFSYVATMQEVPQSFSGLQEPPAPVRRRPIFDQIFEPLLGEVGTIKFAEEEVNRIGGNINKAIDRIHDTDHGVRICNKEAGSGSHGVCFTAGKCRALNGRRVGSCDVITPKTTCCKFERTCSEITSETVTYFESDPSVFTAGHNRCKLRVHSRIGACQIRIDFLDLMLPPADPETGKCSDGARLRITNVIRRPGEREKVETIELCGPNSGQHLYLDVADEGQLVELDFVNTKRSQPFSWHLRITQIDCRTTRDDVQLLRAPPGCLQYHFARTRGAIGSFNFDGDSPMAAGQYYAVCFRSDHTVCAVKLRSHDFSLGGGGSFVHVFDPSDERGEKIGKDRFEGKDFGTVVVEAKPFVLRVGTGRDVDPEAKGFLMEYEFVPC